MKSFSFERLLWACVLIVVGFLLLAQNLNILNQDIWNSVWNLWPLVFVIPGISALLRGRSFGAFGLILIGSLMIYSNFTGANIWGALWPLLIIIFGLSLLFKPRFMGRMNKGHISTDEIITETVVFGGVEKKFDSKKFKGGNIDMIFGGGKIDLRDIEIDGDYAKIEVNAVFGGCEILVNTDNYKLRANGTGIFGGWVNSFNVGKKETPVLEIVGNAIFGGVEIK